MSKVFAVATADGRTVGVKAKRADLLAGGELRFYNDNGEIVAAFAREKWHQVAEQGSLEKVTVSFEMDDT